jgi:pimeloyl-ACP methyl ester carboxylesterase
VWILTSLAALVALAGLFQFAGTVRDRRRFPPPGRMIDIGGGRRLHARVDGTGSPPVLFEAGISASSINWTGIQSVVAQHTATCAYDRAGLSWSDPPRCHYDIDRILADLGALLEAVYPAQPCVLVGHSYGGLLIRLFAERYPERVAGLVLVDSVLATSWETPNAYRARTKRKGIRLARYGAWAARLGLVRLVTAPALVRNVILPRFGGAKAARGSSIGKLQRELSKFPPESLPAIRAHWSHPHSFEAMSAHIATLDASFAALRDLPLRCPVEVISARNTSPEGLVEHRAIAALSPQGEHLMAHSSGHWIQFDEPELVIDAILRVVERTCQRQRT